MIINRMIQKELHDKQFDYNKHKNITSIDDLPSPNEDEVVDWHQLAKDFQNGKVPIKKKIKKFPQHTKVPGHLEKHIENIKPRKLNKMILDNISCVCALMLDGRSWWKSKLQRRIKISPYRLEQAWSFLIELKIIYFVGKHYFTNDQQSPCLLYTLDEPALRMFLKDQGVL